MADSLVTSTPDARVPAHLERGNGNVAGSATGTDAPTKSVQKAGLQQWHVVNSA